MKSNGVFRVIYTLSLFALLVTASAATCAAPVNGAPAAQFSHVLDKQTVFPYPSYAMPSKGTIVTDPTFHTSFQRVTQKSVDGYASPAMTPEYSKTDPSNANGTRVILRGLDAQWYLYDAATLALLNGGPIPN